MKLKMKKAVLGSTGKTMNIMRGFSCRSDKATAVLCRKTGSHAAVAPPRGRVLHPPPNHRRHHHHQRPTLFVPSNEKYMFLPSNGSLSYRNLPTYCSVGPRYEGSRTPRISPFIGNEKYMRLGEKPRATFRDYASSPPSPAARRSGKALLFSGGCSAGSLAIAPVRKGSGGDDCRRREKARKPPARRSGKTLLFTGGCSAAASLALAPVRKGSGGDDGRREKARKPPATAAASSTLSSSNTHVFQVVVMRVSLHCQGCANKLKKHLSKMEGVTSFSIDLENKKVTVMGNVSPAGVLESVSKVKRAEFWPC